MSELRELYQEIILDHNKNPRNFGYLEDADHSSEGHNPLCGDRYTVYARVEDETIKEITFSGEGCAISKSSASIMTELVKGKKAGEVNILILEFQKMLKGEMISDEFREKLHKAAILEGVKEFPVRIKCATLAWHTLKNALTEDGQRKKGVSTENEQTT